MILYDCDSCHLRRLELFVFSHNRFPFSFQNWKGTFHLVLLKRESYIFNDGFFDEAFGDRRKRASVGAIGGHHRQGAPSGTKSRRRQMRRYTLIFGKKVFTVISLLSMTVSSMVK